MKVVTLRIDREAMLKEMEDIDGVQVRVPDTMSNEDAEKMMIDHVPELHKYYYNVYTAKNMIGSRVEKSDDE
jgi:hypothetical protein